MDTAVKIAGAAKTQTPAPPSLRAPTAVWPLLAIGLIAILLRTLTSILLPNLVWPDEIFQATEQALRLVTGRGMTPWEYQIGARSWILPGLVAPLVAAGRAMSADPRAALGLVAALMIAVSVVNVWSACVIGARVGRLHGLFAAGLAAGWCEFVYYAPHLLPDTLSGALLLAALAVASDLESHPRLFWAGVLLGATIVVRVQLAPAIGLVGLALCRTRFGRRGVPLAAGFALPVAALGGLDWLTWGAPFRSVFVYLATNLGGVASDFGDTPALAYLGNERLIWGLATPLVVATAALGTRKAPLVATVAALIALTFSAVAHKELRFIYPALLLVFVLCGIGTAELAGDIGRWIRAPLLRRLVPVGLGLLWAAASLSAGFGVGMRPLWTGQAGALRAFDAVNADPRSCGLGLDPPQWLVSGLSRVRSDLQLYDASETPAEAYNYLLRLPGPSKPLAGDTARGFSLQRCYGEDGACLYRRPGPCRAGAPPLRAVTPPLVRATLGRLGFRVY